MLDFVSDGTVSDVGSAVDDIKSEFVSVLVIVSSPEMSRASGSHVFMAELAAGSPEAEADTADLSLKRQ